MGERASLLRNCEGSGLPCNGFIERGIEIMDRRSFLLGTAGAASLPLGAPALAQPAGSRVLKFIPQADLAVIDPILTTAYVTRHHGFLIYDTLYGIDVAVPGAAADGRRPSASRMAASGSPSPCARAEIPRRRAGAGQGRGAPASSAGGSATPWARRWSLATDDLLGDRRPHPDLPAEEALRAAVRRAGQAGQPGLLHHAGAHRR